MHPRAKCSRLASASVLTAFIHALRQQEAAFLIANPRSIIGSENPLQGRASASFGEGSSAADWREAWRESDEARGLDGAMCMELVSHLQTDESSLCYPLVDCWPRADSR